MFLIKLQNWPRHVVAPPGGRGAGVAGFVFFFMNETRRRRRAPTEAFTRHNKKGRTVAVRAHYEK